MPDYSQVYTVGTSNRSKEEFIELLRHYRVKLLVDIRRFPTSKFAHFQKENLENFLRRNGIDYIYLGKELGGYRIGGYKDYMKTTEFKDGLNKLRDLAKDKIVAICCSERFPGKCHRRFIAFELESYGWRVINIIDKERIRQVVD